MGLNREHQLQLIKDILTDHQLDCCGTVAEYEQVGRIIKVMLSKEDLDAEIRQLLTDIYAYSEKGQSVSSIDTHIQEHQTHLSEWVENIHTLA
ncbi:YtzH-like family protein [Bacillus sp. NPDC077027]|uniref:YtzH-like family protein n=1 Tax=Bacillus sp. NPDC077027 TaxID=3390548 RepID=UPI003D09592D